MQNATATPVDATAVPPARSVAALRRPVLVVSPEPPSVAVVGAGPAGLMAADVLARGGARVTVFDRMPTAGRKFLMAGRGGL